MGSCSSCCKWREKQTVLTHDEKVSIQTETNYTLEEIQDMYNVFMQEYPSGKLLVDDLMALYGNCYPSGNPSAFASLMFKTFDKNQDGVLEFKEVVMGLSIFSRGTLDDKLRWIFSAYDINQTGYISKDEMLCIYEIVHKFDPNICMCPMERTESVFSMMDENEDGEISIEEFLKAARQDKSLVYPIPV